MEKGSTLVDLVYRDVPDDMAWYAMIGGVRHLLFEDSLYSLDKDLLNIRLMLQFIDNERHIEKLIVITHEPASTEVRRTVEGVVKPREVLRPGDSLELSDEHIFVKRSY